MIDDTHDPKRRSWVASANGHADFPIQNLPFGVFSPADEKPRGGVAIGDMILDLPGLIATGLLGGGDIGLAAAQASASSLNGFLQLGAAKRSALRRRLSELLTEGNHERERVEACLHASADCKVHVPATIGDYTDFYVGIHHAMNVGKQFRPDNPLLPNYKHIPIGYHGRASSIVASGTSVRRPRGQTKAADAPGPTFGPTARLDYELELGVWVGPGNEQGDQIPIDKAKDHIAGYCLLNDWSARDIQAWEYQPLGPFLAKNFASTISAWIVTPEALAPFRASLPARPDGDPAPLPYLADEVDAKSGGLDIELEVLVLTKGLRDKKLPPHRVALSNSRFMYWSVAQMVAHHTSNGCNLQPGDLIGTGTISGPTADSCGSLLEASQGGKVPIALASGEQRRFLEDGDEVIFRAHARRDGCVSIGFGECRGQVVASK